MLVGLPIIGSREANGRQQLYNLRHQQGLMQGGITITEPYATFCKTCLIFTCCTERHMDAMRMHVDICTMSCDAHTPSP